MKEDKNNRVTIIELPETPYGRLISEKRHLDEKITKLNAFLADEEKANKIAGYTQVGLMQRQLDVMLEYSSILNTRILRWQEND